MPGDLGWSHDCTESNVRAFIIVASSFILLSAFAARPPNRTNRSARPVSEQELRIQVLLDRAHFSPGEIDGAPGRRTRKALADYTRAGHTLIDDSSVPTLIEYTIADEDIRGPFVKVPADLVDQASLSVLGYQ